MADFRSGCDHRVSLRNHSKPSGGFFDRVTRIVEKDRDSPAAPEELFDTGTGAPTGKTPSARAEGCASYVQLAGEEGEFLQRRRTCGSSLWPSTSA
jgi:hypothetical protein